MWLLQMETVNFNLINQFILYKIGKKWINFKFIPHVVFFSILKISILVLIINKINCI